MRLHSSIVALALLGGCASAPGRPVDPPITVWTDLYPEVVDPNRVTAGPRDFFKARPFSEAQGKALDTAIRVYIQDGDEAFAPLRDELAADPVTAFWLARMLIRFVTEARIAVPDDPLAPLVGEPVWERPMRHIEAMGAAAVPTVVLDQLRDPRSDNVALGGELLARIGPSAVPRWQGVLELQDERARRKGVEALGSFEERTPAIIALLEARTDDPAFGVRAAAYVGLAREPEQAVELIDVLKTDDDPFVRRELALALGAHRDRAIANALVDYMETCIQDGDERGMLAADEALRKMSGKQERATPQTWRSWASTIRSN